MLCTRSQGHLEPKADMRSQAYHRKNPQYEHADAWLNWAYWHVAEPLAETKQTETADASQQDFL